MFTNKLKLLEGNKGSSSYACTIIIFSDTVCKVHANYRLSVSVSHLEETQANKLIPAKEAQLIEIHGIIIFSCTIFTFFPVSSLTQCPL